MAKAGAIEIPITLGGVREVRQEIKNLRGELINATDPKEVARLSENIGELSDKLKDANEKANVFASGSKFEQASNAFGLMGSQIASLDFEGAGESAALFANRIKSINPSEFGTQLKGMVSVVGNLSKAFIQMGVTLLANPIFIIALVITAIVAVIALLLNKLGFLKPILNAIGAVFSAIGDAIQWVIDKIKEFLDWIGLTNYAEQDAANKAAESQSKKADAYEQGSKKRVSAIDQAIRMDQLDGKNTVEMEIKKQQILRQTAYERAKALTLKYKALMLSGDYDAEEIKKLKEDLATSRETIKTSTNEIAYIRKKDQVDRAKEEENANAKSIEAGKAANQKRLEDQKKYNENRRSIARELENLTIQVMEEGEAKERATIEFKYKQAIEDVKLNEKYLKDERAKVIALLLQEQSNELNAIDEVKKKEKIEKEIEFQKQLAEAEADAKLELNQIIENAQAQIDSANVSKQDNELNAIRDKYFAQIELAKKYGMDATALEELQQKELQAVKDKYAAEELANKKKLQEQSLEAVKGSLTAIGSIAEAWASKDKERQKKAFNLQKGANIATATIDTYKGATAAFANAGNPILGAIMAAITVAAGLANIAKIKSTTFEGGGTGSSPSTNVSVPNSQQNLAPTFAFQGSGNNANSVNSQNDFSGITVKAVVSESEVTGTQNKIKKFNDNATL